MADGLERLLNLYGLLLRANAQVPLTLRAARAAVAPLYDDYEGESGRKAFRRDREHLERTGVPIRTSYQTDVAGAPGWWIPADEWFLPGLDLTGDERAALARAARMVDFRDVLWAPLAGAKLTGKGPDALAGRPVETVAVFVAPPALPALQEARSRRSTASFTYGGRPRVLDPWGLAHARGHWYVVGREHPTGAPGDGGPPAGGAAASGKVFRVDRITGPVTVGAEEGAFEVPPADEVRALVPADLWSWGGPAFDVRVAVDAEVAGIVAADVGSGLTVAERSDGRVELSFRCTQRGVFLSWVLGLGDRAEVLDPPDLRAEVVDRLRAVATAVDGAGAAAGLVGGASDVGDGADAP